MRLPDNDSRAWTPVNQQHTVGKPSRSAYQVPPMSSWASYIVSSRLGMFLGSWIPSSMERSRSWQGSEERNWNGLVEPGPVDEGGEDGAEEPSWSGVVGLEE